MGSQDSVIYKDTGFISWISSLLYYTLQQIPQKSPLASTPMINKVNTNCYQQQ